MTVVGVLSCLVYKQLAEIININLYGYTFSLPTINVQHPAMKFLLAPLAALAAVTVVLGQGQLTINTP